MVLNSVELYANMRNESSQVETEEWKKGIFQFYDSTNPGFFSFCHSVNRVLQLLVRDLIAIERQCEKKR